MAPDSAVLWTPEPVRDDSDAGLSHAEVFVALRQTLNELSELSANWDSYGANPPSAWAVEAAWRHASGLVDAGFGAPDVFPTRDGGIQLEWHRGGASLEWELDARGQGGSFFFTDAQGNERFGSLPDDRTALFASLRRV